MIGKLDDELFELIDDEGELTSEYDQAGIFKQYSSIQDISEA